LRDHRCWEIAGVGRSPAFRDHRRWEITGVGSTIAKTRHESRKMNLEKIPVFKPLIEQEEFDATREALELGWLGMLKPSRSSCSMVSATASLSAPMAGCAPDAIS
jgi:hypothetical protein